MKKTIIGLGNTGCRICNFFSIYEKYYDILKINNTIEGDNSFVINTQTMPEEYEQNTPNMKDFLKCEKDVIFIVNGAEYISACSLRILEQIKNHNITILYIKPDLDWLTDIEKKQQRVVYNVLQEYARSNVFEKMIIIDMIRVENILGDLSLETYEEKINEMISWLIHSINIFDNTKKFKGSESTPYKTTKLQTIGVSSLEEEKKLLFDLKNVREKVYYFSIGEESLKSTKVMRMIKNKIKEEEENVRVSYGIYPIEGNETNVFYIYKSADIQK